jgi:hypothetical protein
MFDESIDQDSVVQIYRDPYQQAVKDYCNSALSLRDRVIDLAVAAGEAGKSRADVFRDIEREAPGLVSKATFYRHLSSSDDQELLPEIKTGRPQGRKSFSARETQEPTEPATPLSLSSFDKGPQPTATDPRGAQNHGFKPNGLNPAQERPAGSPNKPNGLLPTESSSRITDTPDTDTTVNIPATTVPDRLPPAPAPVVDPLAREATEAVVTLRQLEEARQRIQELTGEVDKLKAGQATSTASTRASILNGAHPEAKAIRDWALERAHRELDNERNRLRNEAEQLRGEVALDVVTLKRVIAATSVPSTALIIAFFDALVEKKLDRSATNKIVDLIRERAEKLGEASC